MHELKLSNNNNILSGNVDGIKERGRLELDKYENTDRLIRIIIPETITAINTSFMIGLFTDSLNNFDTKEEFYSKYKFISDDEFVKLDIVDGIDYIYKNKSYCISCMEEKKKVGKPKKKITREKQYRLRMTEEEFHDLELLSRQTNLTQADVIRRALKEFKEKRQRRR